MSPPGARGPQGRGAPSQQESRPVMDRTASLPNLGTAMAGLPPAGDHRRSQRDDPPRTQIRQSAVSPPTSPTTPTRYGPPSMCRPVPTKTPVPANRNAPARTPENQFSVAPPPTHSNQKITTQPLSSNTRPTHTQKVHPPSFSDATQTMPRPNQGTIPAPQTTARNPTSRNIAPNTARPALSLNTATDARTNRDPRSNRDYYRQMAPLAPAPITGSPAPPRTSAYDSPATRSAQSSLSGSTTSLASDCRRAEFEVADLITPTSPTPSTGMEMELDFQAGSRALRRRRSPDEATREEAKRHCVDAVRYGAESPTYAEAARRTPTTSPNTSTAPINYYKNPSGTSNPPVLAPNPKTTPEPPADTITESMTAKKKRPRYPPLVVEKLPNWASHFRALAATLGRPPNARPYGQGVRFSPESEDEYRTVQKYLTTLEKESGVSWFAYSLPADKKLKVAIRGIPPDTDPQEIEEELRELGYEPVYVRHINARQGRPGCVFHAVLNKTENVRSIFDISTFMLMRGVKVEAWRGKRGPAQCHRCQKFRHSSHQCHRPLACVRCGEGHTARDCPRPREEPATCANCKGPHPANNTKCPIFQQEIKCKRAGTVAISTVIARRPQKPAQLEERPQEEAQGASLMAAANGPTQRGAAISSEGRRKKKRGGKGKRSNPPTTNQESTQEAATIPVPEPAQAVQTTKKTISANITHTQRHLAADHRSSTDQSASANLIGRHTQANHNEAPTNQSAPSTQNKNFTACAIQLLMDLIKAIRQGQNVEQVILDGLAALLTLYHE